jgi:hypothetical protein
LTTKTSNAYQSRWKDRDSDVGPVRVRRLKDKEVPQSLHREKPKRGLGAQDSFYVDKDGNIYSGSEDGGELTYEGNMEDWEEE